MNPLLPDLPFVYGLFWEIEPGKYKKIRKILQSKEGKCK